MIRVMIAAARSGSGKTTVACALLRALQKRGLKPCAFKCGPDYIDPMFHRAALGVESHNLDLFLSCEAQMKALYTRACQGHGAAVCEGVMGLYDGLGVSDRASTWQVADALDMPVVLVVPARGASLTLAAEIRGLCAFRRNSRVAGVILNECAPRLAEALAPALERETGVPVLGCLPRAEAARVGSRHLGLLTAREIEGLDERLAVLARTMEETVDMERLLALCEREAPAQAHTEPRRERRCRIAVARDEAFSFAYAETLETLEARGAELVFFSPLHDAALPEHIGGLYLPGGYPELYAKELSENAAMRRAVAEAVRGGMPVVAECGGFVYLGAALRDDQGRGFPMAGVLPGESANAGHLVRFGYGTLCAQRDSLLFRAGERVPVHEFHYWESSACGGDLVMEKGERSWRFGFASDTLYAAFPHLYFAGRPALAERFVDAAERYGER